jgi:hypothetical protein
MSEASRWLVIEDVDGGLLVPLAHVQFATVRTEKKLFRRPVFVLEIETSMVSADPDWALSSVFKSREDAVEALDALELALEAVRS